MKPSYSIVNIKNNTIRDIYELNSRELNCLEWMKETNGLLNELKPFYNSLTFEFSDAPFIQAERIPTEAEMALAKDLRVLRSVAKLEQDLKTLELRLKAFTNAEPEPSTEGGFGIGARSCFISHLDPNPERRDQTQAYLENRIMKLKAAKAQGAEAVVECVNDFNFILIKD